MSRILLDEGVPIGVRGFLISHDGDLIAAADGAGYEVMITAVQNIRYQQNLANRRIALVAPIEGSNDTSPISPRRGGISEMLGRDCVANQRFGPVLRLLLACLVRGHRRVTGGEVSPRHVRTR
jgi:hypothetical protein